MSHKTDEISTSPKGGRIFIHVGKTYAARWTRNIFFCLPAAYRTWANTFRPLGWVWPIAFGSVLRARGWS